MSIFFFATPNYLYRQSNYMARRGATASVSINPLNCCKTPAPTGVLPLITAFAPAPRLSAVHTALKTKELPAGPASRCRAGSGQPCGDFSFRYGSSLPPLCVSIPRPAPGYSRRLVACYTVGVEVGWQHEEALAVGLWHGTAGGGADLFSPGHWQSCHRQHTYLSGHRPGRVEFSPPWAWLRLNCWRTGSANHWPEA